VDSAIERLAAVATTGGSGSTSAWPCDGELRPCAARERSSPRGRRIGASAYLAASPLQRLQSDVEVLKGHVLFDWERTTALASRCALELPLRPTDMI
jgi:hypothetical protein